MERPTIADIARRAGVSKGAVSFALNGRPGVSDSTRARILAVADEMQWRPHSAARALGQSRAGAVGLILSRPAQTLGLEPFFGQLVSGLQAGLSKDGTALQLLIVEDTAAEVEAYRRWTAERRVDGFVVVDLLEDDPRLPVLEQLRIPVLVVGGPLEGEGLSYTWADDTEAMLSLIDYLAALGHHDIVHVAGLPQFRHTQRRMEALEGSRPRLDLHCRSIPTDYSDSEGAAITRRLLSSRERPSAIIYDSDVMAVAGLGVALEMGIDVPTELSMVSFEDSLLTRLTHPALTALARDTQAWGANIGRLLLELVADPGLRHYHQLPTPHLVVRESTARARRS
jgi:DNA-binding LacI/PurR family transcriptional regulator